MVNVILNEDNNYNREMDYSTRFKKFEIKTGGILDSMVTRIVYHTTLRHLWFMIGKKQNTTE